MCSIEDLALDAEYEKYESSIGEVEGVMKFNVTTNYGNNHTVDIPVTVNCEVDVREEECHGFHTFYDVDENSYYKAFQNEVANFLLNKDESNETICDYLEYKLSKGEEIVSVEPIKE